MKIALQVVWRHLLLPGKAAQVLAFRFALHGVFEYRELPHQGRRPGLHPGVQHAAQWVVGRQDGGR